MCLFGPGELYGDIVPGILRLPYASSSVPFIDCCDCQTGSGMNNIQNSPGVQRELLIPLFWGGHRISLD